MAFISSITLPDNSTYDIKDARLSGIITVNGTQTTSTASWTGNINIPALYDGLTIAYYLPRTSAANVTLNLTLSDETTTGAINVYATDNTRMGTQYDAGSTIYLTYWSAGSISVNGVATSEARWTSSSAAGVDISGKQNKVLDTPVVVEGQTKTTVQSALSALANASGGGSTPLGSWQMTLADGSPFTVTLTDSGQQTLVQGYTQLEMNDMLSTLTSLDNLVGVTE